MLFKSRALGLTNTIIRLGNLQGNTRTKKFQINDLDNAFLSQIKGFIKLGIAPDIDFELDYTPIDHAAEACVKLISISTNTNGIYHIYNPYSLYFKELIDGFSIGKQLNFVPHNKLYHMMLDLFQQQVVDEEILRFGLHTGIFKDDKDQTKFSIHSERTNII